MSTVHLAGFVVAQKNRTGGDNRVIVGCYQHGLPHRSELRCELPLDNSLIVARLDRKRLGQDTFTTNWNSIRGVFDEQTRRKPLVFAADAVRYGI
jgi:hypothetical protein